MALQRIGDPVRFIRDPVRTELAANPPPSEYKNESGQKKLQEATVEITGRHTGSYRFLSVKR